MLDILIHDAVLQMRSCDEISFSDGLRAFHETAPQPHLARDFCARAS
jgi:hypothetical protein